MGLLQAEQTGRGKEGVGPALMVGAAGIAPPLGAPAQDRAQAPTDEAVERREARPVAVLEVGEPAPQHGVEIADDTLQGLSQQPRRARPDGLSELGPALVARPTPAALEPVAQELE